MAKGNLTERVMSGGMNLRDLIPLTGVSRFVRRWHKEEEVNFVREQFSKVYLVGLILYNAIVISIPIAAVIYAFENL